MSRPYHLSSQHFAASWPTSNETAVQNDREVVNNLAIRFADLQEGPEKEEVFLQLVKFFHGYLMKYLFMVVRGIIPSPTTPAGKDSIFFLKTLMPKHMPVNHQTLLAMCRSLHLAFKQQSTDDIYDNMVYCFLRACRKYDPHYSTKVKEVYQAIDAKLKCSDQVAVEQVSEAVGFNSLNCIRWLGSKGVLQSITDSKRVVGYTWGKNWPANPKLFASGPIGFTYYAVRQFKYYLNEYVKKQMEAVEAQEHVLQLDYLAGSNSDNGPIVDEPGLPHRYGNITDREGSSWAADTYLMDAPLDISEMSHEWVKATNDKLFKNLTPTERLILKMAFVDERTWVDIGATLDCNANTAKANFDQIMEYLRNRANAKKAS